MVMKEFKVLELHEDGVHGTLQCPRKGCKGKFTVERSKFKGEGIASDLVDGIVTRACPYCFRVSLLPGQAAASEERAGRRRASLYGEEPAGA
jgi:hypothetical protein